jgi:hypothetical protein
MIGMQRRGPGDHPPLSNLREPSTSAEADGYLDPDRYWSITVARGREAHHLRDAQGMRIKVAVA